MSDEEAAFIDIVNQIDENAGVKLEIPVIEYSLKLNILSNLCAEFSDGEDILEL